MGSTPSVPTILKGHMFTKLLRRWRGLPEHQFQVGDIVTSPYVTDEFEKVIEIRPSSWKGIDVRVEINEPFKFFNRPNPRRKIWVHETWVKLVRAAQ